jgi:hypothetical protein
MVAHPPDRIKAASLRIHLKVCTGAAIPINHGYRYLGGRKKLALITELFSAYMEPLFYVSRGKSGEADTGKRDYRNL